MVVDFEEEPKEEIARKFFHPAYLVQNWSGILDHTVTTPQADFGPPQRTADDIIALDINGEPVEEILAHAHNPMLPPLKYTLENYKANAKRGRPRKRRLRSRGSALAADGGAPARRGGNVMTQEDWKRHCLQTQEQELDRW